MTRRIRAEPRERLRRLVELEFSRFLEARAAPRSQQAIDSFAIQSTTAGTRLFLNALTESDVIALLGGRPRAGA